MINNRWMLFVLILSLIFGLLPLSDVSAAQYNYSKYEVRLTSGFPSNVEDINWQYQYDIGLTPTSWRGLDHNSSGYFYPLGSQIMSWYDEPVGRIGYSASQWWRLS